VLNDLGACRAEKLWTCLCLLVVSPRYKYDLAIMFPAQLIDCISFARGCDDTGLRRCLAKGIFSSEVGNVLVYINILVH
jgi:hypothetical protein